MEKNRQQTLIHWLKQKSIISRRLSNISRLLGSISGLLIVTQAWLLSHILSSIITESILRDRLLPSFVVLILVFILRVWIIWLRERVNFHAGQHIRYEIRRQVLDKLEESGPIWIKGRPVGSWATLILEQIDNMQDYYAHYLPQVSIAIFVPLLVVISVFLKNWIASLILLFTAPLIPLFMILVGKGAEEANRRNFLALGRLSGYFLDRLRGIDTIRLYGRSEAEVENIHLNTQDFRKRTMEVLRLAFLSSAVLEFFASLSIAFVAVYFGFSYLGILDFGYNRTGITFSAGFLSLILAPEFFQPLRDLGSFYHAKAQAVGAADILKTFLDMPLVNPKRGNIVISGNKPITIIAENFSVLSPDGAVLAGPLNFTLFDGQRVAIVGTSGSGKSSLLNAISGFMAYTGSLRVNGIELCSLNLDAWRMQLSWVGQHPQLFATTLRNNILLGRPNAGKEELQSALDHAFVSEFLPHLQNGIETVIGDQGTGLSVGQAQRVAVARALLHPCNLLLLDEPTASLDIYSEQRVMQTLVDVTSYQHTTLMVTHHLERIVNWDSIWVMSGGRIIEQGNFSTLSVGDGHFATLLADIQENV